MKNTTAPAISAISRIGLAVDSRPTPALATTGISLSVFIALSTLTAPIRMPNGRVSVTNCGVSKTIICRNALIEPALPVAKSMRVTACVTHTTPSMAANAPTEAMPTRRNM